MGLRGTGALEFAPIKGPEPTVGEDIQVGELVELASRILDERDGFATLSPPPRNSSRSLDSTKGSRCSWFRL